MNILYVPSTMIVAAGPYVDAGKTLDFKDAIIPKDAVPGYKIADVQVPQDFTPSTYAFVNGALEKLPPPPPQVPDQVTGPSGRSIMQFHDLETKISTYIATISDEKLRLLMTNGYASTPIFYRNDKMLNVIFKGIGKTSDEVDAYFVEAKQLSTGG